MLVMLPGIPVLIIVEMSIAMTRIQSLVLGNLPQTGIWKLCSHVHNVVAGQMAPEISTILNIIRLGNNQTFQALK